MENISNNKDFMSYFDFPYILDSAYLKQTNLRSDLIPARLDLSVPKGTATVDLLILRFFVKFLLCLLKNKNFSLKHSSRIRFLGW